MVTWAEILTAALDLERRAETIRTLALSRRCDAWMGSGGTRCTRDKGHEPGHRHEQDDLPNT